MRQRPSRPNPLVRRHLSATMSVAPGAAGTSVDAGGAVRWLLALTQFLLIVDTAILNVAVPSVGDEFGLSSAAQTWVLNAYTVAFAGLLLLSGSLADRFGLHRVLTCGLVIVVLGAAAGAVAGTGEVVIASRAVQGVGAALVGAAAMAGAFALFSGARRRRALGLFASMAGLGGAVGTLSGGVLTQWLGWRSTFWAITITAALLGEAVWVLRARLRTGHHGARRPGGPRGVGGPRRLNVPSSVGLTITLAAVAFAVTSGGGSGRGGLATVAVVVAVLGVVVFARGERRGIAPLIDRRVWSNRPLLVSLGLAAASQWLLVPALLFVSLYLQRVLGTSPSLTGLALLPMSVLICVIGPLVPVLIGRTSLRGVVVAAFATITLAVSWLGTISPSGSYLADVLGPTLLLAAGLPAVAVATNLVVASHAPGDIPGLASGLLTTAQQFGGAIGLATWAGVSATAHRWGLAIDSEGMPVAYLAAGLAGLLTTTVAMRLGRRTYGTDRTAGDIA